jgi:hypothetical protein
MAKAPVNNNIPTKEQVQDAFSKSSLSSTKAQKLKDQINARIKYQQDSAKKSNENEINGKGFEGFVTRTTKTLGKIEKSIDDIYRGNPYKQGGIKVPGKEERIKGIINFLYYLNDVDFCNLVNYILNTIQLEGTGAPSRGEVAVNFVKTKAKDALKIIDAVFVDSDQLLNNAITIGDKVILLIDVNEIGKQGETITILNQGQLSILRRNPNSYTKENTKFKETLKNIGTVLKEISSLIDDPDVKFLVPKISNGNGFIGDYIAKVDSTYALDSIPNEDVRNLLSKLKQVRSVLALIAGISTAGDALGAIQSATGLKIDKQIQKLQKFLDVSQLIPLVRSMIKLVDSINQSAQLLLKNIKIAVTITNIIGAIVRIFKKIVRLFDKLFLPLIFGTYSVTSVLDGVKSKITVELEKAIKVIEQITQLIKIVYKIIGGLTFKLQNISTQLQILQTNLEGCNSTDNSPLIDQIKEARNKIISSIQELDTYSSLFESVDNKQEFTYGPYILKIQEEELVDNGKRLKRRKGIALDNTGVLIAETDLTFATDVRIIIEELKLKLQNKGVDEIYGGGTGYPEIDKILEETGGDEDLVTIEEIDQEDADELEIKNDLDEALNSIKGMRRLRRRVRAKVQASKIALAEGIKQGRINPNNSVSNSLTISPEPTETNTGTPVQGTSPDILSDQDRANIEESIRKYRRQLTITVTRGLRNIIEYKIKQLQTKLEKDRIARGN